MSTAPSIPAGSDRRAASGKPLDFSLPDTTGRTHQLVSLKDRKAFVIVFVGTACPINNQYWSRLNELHKEFAAQGVQFFAIDANVQDAAEDIARLVQRMAPAFPVLADRGNVVADQFGAQRTPEAFVLDSGRVIRYQGRIDDRFGVDYTRPAPSRHDLAAALCEVLAGKKVSVPSTPVAGCFIGRAPRVAKQGPITFSKHIAPLLQKHCQECHRPGQIGPMPLLTYDDATSWADTIREVVREERMPPWYADPRHGKFANDRRLLAEERKTLLAWLDQGMPRGADKDLPPPKKFAEGWRIGIPDVVIPMPREFDVPAEMPRLGVPYKHFVVQTNFPEDRWVERAETRAGAPDVVHHILVFVVPPGQKFFPGNPRTPTLAGTAPGDMPFMARPGMAKRLPKGARLVFQMHYTPNGKATKDLSKLGLIFAKKPPTHEIITRPIFNLALRIPPGDNAYEAVSSYTLSKDGLVVGMMPHMHLRGKDFLYRAHYPDGSTSTLLSVPRFNFNWQSVYRPLEPVAVPKGTRIECVGHFDNSVANRSNPDPTRWVYWGDQTWEEMMIGWIDFAFARPAS
jgi:peroxiredoxin